jgi:hypothetical protein
MPEINALVQINGTFLRFVGYEPIYQVDCAIFKNDRHDSFTIMKKSLADSGLTEGITGSTDLVMIEMPETFGNPTHVGSAVSAVFGIGRGDYSFVTVVTDRNSAEKYWTASCWEKMGFRHAVK